MAFSKIDVNPHSEDFAHLLELECVGLDVKHTFLLLLDRFLQVTHCQIFPDIDRERVAGHIDNPTEKCELVI